MRLISAGSLVRAQSGPAFAWHSKKRMPESNERATDRQNSLVNASRLRRGRPFSSPHFQFEERCSELEINKGHRTCCRKKFERQKSQHVCRDLNAGWLQSQAINELITFLSGRQKQRNEKEHDRTSRQQESTSYMLETE